MNGVYWMDNGRGHSPSDFEGHPEDAYTETSQAPPPYLTRVSQVRVDYDIVRDESFDVARFDVARETVARCWGNSQTVYPVKKEVLTQRQKNMLAYLRTQLSVSTDPPLATTSAGTLVLPRAQNHTEMNEFVRSVAYLSASKQLKFQNILKLKTYQPPPLLLNVDP